jgi:hypothetical protein
MKTPARRSGKPTSTPFNGAITHFTSRSAVGGTSELGNYFITMDEAGNPYTGSQQGAYALTPIHFDPTVYFAANLFGAYDYYKVEDCETTLTWTTTPTNGVPIAGEILFVLDKDSRTPVPLSQVANRNELQSRVFTNNTIRHIIKWQPYLVEDSQTEGVPGAQVDYIQPRGRWLNTDNSSNHRFGTLRLIAQNFDAGNGYPTAGATLQIRHRVKIAVKGLRSTQPSPSLTSDEVSDTTDGSVQ